MSKYISTKWLVSCKPKLIYGGSEVSYWFILFFFSSSFPLISSFYICCSHQFVGGNNLFTRSLLIFPRQDLLWHVFKEKVDAKMMPQHAFSSPHYGKKTYRVWISPKFSNRLMNNLILYIVWCDTGQALVIFKSKEAASFVISKLNRKCLVLADERYPVYLTFSVFGTLAWAAFSTGDGLFS